VSRPGTLERESPAKLNLFLQIVGKRADGYHELVSVMQTLDLADRMRARLTRRTADAPRVTLVLGGPRADASIPVDARNLAVAAALAVLDAARADAELGVALELEKHVPAAGGLGGGSSNAATALRLVNELLGEPLDDRALHTLAARLGSDVNVFLVGGTVLALGRGERVRAVDPPADFDATLLLPPFGASTPAVYAALDAPPLHADWTVSDAEARGAEVAASVRGASAQDLRTLFRNDLEHAACRAEPRLRELLAPPARRLCGSGSTLFQLGREDHDAAQTCESKPIRFLTVRSRKR